MRILCSLILLYALLLSKIGFAQDAYTDSLKSVLESSKEDTNKVQTLIALGQDAWAYDPQEGIRYSLAAQYLADKLDYKKGVSQAFKDVGIGHYFQGEYMVAIEYWQLSLEAYESIGNYEGVANLQSNIGAVYSVIGDEARAIEYYLKSLRTSEEINNPNRIATALQNIGAIYSLKPTTYARAKEYYWRALPYGKESGNNTTLGNILSNLGEIHFRTNDYDSALYYFKESLVPNKGTSALSYSLTYMGRIYADRDDFQEAIRLHDEAISSAEDLNAKLELSIALIGLASTYMKQGYPTRAIEKLEDAQQIAKDIGSLDQIKESYEGLSDAYALAADFQNAYRYEVLFADLKDTIYSETTDEKIKGLQFSYELDKKQSELELKESEIEKANILRNFLIAGAIFLVIIIAGVTYQYWFTRKSNKIIAKEKERSENLLLNILPAETAEELKENGTAKARMYDMVSILFTDFKGFTSIAAQLSPEELVREIDNCYKHFDEIITNHGIEKIKTIGDAYMAAGGLPKTNKTHPEDTIKAALEIREFMLQLQKKNEQEGKPYFEIRIGIHTGPVVSGIVGIKKFAYDIWGDTVNIAARMESNSEPGKINISESTYKLIGDKYKCEYRGEIEAKNRGMLKMYFVESQDSGMEEQTEPVSAGSTT